MGNLELLERAFALAESGEVADIDALRQKLLEDGVAIADLEQFRGRALARQLCNKIRSASARKNRRAPPVKSHLESGDTGPRGVPST